MWPCYGVHITGYIDFLLCTLSVSAFIEPPLHQLDFFLEIFSMETSFCSFLIKLHVISFNSLFGATNTLAVDASSSHVCTDEWRPTASTFCPLSLPYKKARVVSPSYAQSKAQMNHSQRISRLLVAISNATCIALHR